MYSLFTRSLVTEWRKLCIRNVSNKKSNKQLQLVFTVNAWQHRSQMQYLLSLDAQKSRIWPLWESCTVKHTIVNTSLYLFVAMKASSGSAWRQSPVIMNFHSRLEGPLLMDQNSSVLPHRSNCGGKCTRAPWTFPRIFVSIGDYLKQPDLALSWLITTYFAEEKTSPLFTIDFSNMLLDWGYVMRKM